MTAAGSRRTTLVVFVTIFLDLVGFGIILPIQPFYAETFGASPPQVTLLGASYSLMQFLFAPFWGRLSDRVGRRPVMLVSIAASAAGYTWFALAESLPMLYGARLLAGFGNANLGTAQAIMADTTSAQERARGMGMVGAAFGLGFVCGPALGGLFGQISLAAPGYAATGLAVANWALAFWLLPETHARRGTGSAARLHLGLSLSALRRIAQRRNVRLLLLLFFGVSLAFSQLEQVLGLFIERTFIDAPPSLDTVKHAAALTTQVLLAVGLTMVIVQGMLIGRLARAFGERRLIVAGTFLLALGLAAMPLAGKAGSFSLVIAVCVLLAVGMGVTNPSLSGFLSRSVGEDEQGVALGIGQSLAALGRVFGPSAAGLLFSVGHDLPFWVAAALMLCCVAAALVLRRRPVTAP